MWARQVSPLHDPRLDSSSRGANVVRRDHRRRHGDGADAARYDFIDIFGRDARNRDPGNLHLPRGLPSIVEAGDKIPRLGAAFEYRPDANIVGAVEDGRARLLDAMRADPENLVAADELADLARGKIVLPDVNAVGAAEKRDVGAVVDDAPDLVPPAQVNQLFRAAQKVSAFQSLFAKLQAISAAKDRLLGDSVIST